MIKDVVINVLRFWKTSSHLLDHTNGSSLYANLFKRVTIEAKDLKNLRQYLARPTKLLTSVTKLDLIPS